jgi:DNA-binding NtrC family response regulator
MKILIIDDDIQKANLLSERISEHEISIETDPFKAVSKIRNRYDAVLCDVFFDAKEQGGKILDMFISAKSCRLPVLYSAAKEAIINKPVESAAYDFNDLIEKLPMLLRNLGEEQYEEQPSNNNGKIFGRRESDSKPQYNKDLCDLRHVEELKSIEKIETNHDKLSLEVKNLKDATNNKFLSLAVALIMLLIGIITKQYIH